MTDIGYRRYYADVSAAFAGFTEGIVAAGWTLHDSVSASSKVYKSNGEEGIYPYIYLHIWINSTRIQSNLYLYWNATTHAGTASAFKTGDLITFNTPIWGFLSGNKDILAFSSSISGYCTIAGFCNKLFYPEITNTTSLSSLGDNVILDVDSSSGIVKGQRIQIVGINYEGRDQLQVTDVPDGTHITVLNIPRDYASGAFLGVTPCPAFISKYNSTAVYPLCPRNAVGNEDLISLDIGSFYGPISSAYVDPDYSSYYYVLTPIYIVANINSVTDSLIGYIDNDIMKISAGGSHGDVFAVNAAGTPEQGTASAATSNSLTDSSKSWVVNEWANKRLVLVDGTGSGPSHGIVSNTSDTLALDSNFQTTPDITTTYRIVDKVYRFGSYANQFVVFLENSN